MNRYVLLALLLCGMSNGIRVIVFLQGTSIEERQPLMYIAQTLAHRNHKVAAVKVVIIPEQKQLVRHKLHDARELTLGATLTDDALHALQDTRYSIWNYTGQVNDWYARNTEAISSAYEVAYAQACQPSLDSDLIDRLREGSYDVALVYAEQPCNAALMEVINVPVILLDQHGFSDSTAMAASAASLPASIIPSSESAFSPAALYETSAVYLRMQNMLYYLQELCAIYCPHVIAKAVSRRYGNLDTVINSAFANDYELHKSYADGFPTLSQIRRDAALYFVNSDAELEFYGRETPPNVVYIGGYHIDPPKPLFSPWNETAASAPNGIVIVNFGQRASFSNMPQQYQEAMFQTFARLKKYRFIVYTDRIELNVSVSDNVNVTRWIPQNELLASKPSQLLITNGGMHSVMEAAIYGVPILGMPIHAPNYANLRKLEAHGMARILDWSNVTAESFYENVNALLHDPKYKKASAQFARNYQSRGLGGYETLLYWIEYIAENHGTKLLKQPNALRQMPLFIRLSLDVLCVFVATPLLLFMSTRRLMHVATRSNGVNAPNKNTEKTSSKTDERIKKETKSDASK